MLNAQLKTVLFRLTMSKVKASGETNFIFQASLSRAPQLHIPKTSVGNGRQD
jgi:hypothetical protein